ncbi:MAG: ABC transporter permease [Planctomycetota bacterium]
MSRRAGDSTRRRSVTTLLGVAWGTFATVALLSFSAGLEEEMADRAHGLGEGILILWPGETARSFAGFPEGRRIRLSHDDVQLLRQSVMGEGALSPETMRRVSVASGDATYSVVLSGVTPEFEGLRRMLPRPGGRFLSARDEVESRKVAFLGDSVAASLFPDGPAEGRSVVLAGTRFTVVGVMAPKTQDSDYGGKDDRRVCIPASTYRAQFGEVFVDNLVMRPSKSESAQELKAQVTAHIAGTHSFDPEDEAALDWWDTTEGDRVRSYIFLAMDILTGGAGLLTLLVGGLGVAHLAFLRVRARTEEIGLCLALGATRRRVLWTTLVGGMGVTIAGGALGLGLASTAGWLVGASSLAASVGVPTISPLLAMGVVVTLVLLGAAASWFPAKRAANLDPIAALNAR